MRRAPRLSLAAATLRMRIRKARFFAHPVPALSP